MELYLVQHGEAKSKTKDSGKSLTQQGEQDVRKMAAWAAKNGLLVNQIRHSGKFRAEQTAKILRDHLTPPKGVIAVSGMSPNDDVQPISEELQKESRPVMFVGHLPYLSRLASFLLINDPEQTIIKFRMGGIVCLEREEDQWTVAWIVMPALSS